MKLKDLKLDKDKTFFTSDTHFCHANIIKYCKRPFENVYRMNDALVENWNKVVPKDSVVFHLGDVALRSPQKVLNELLYSLNGTIYLIVGNHEKDALRKEHIRKRWAGIHDIAEIFVEDEEITYGNQHIVMCHYPMIAWNAAHRGSWHLFGHVHGGLSNKGKIEHHPAAMDVGVDCHDFKPISYEQVKEQITKQMLNKR